MADIKLKLAASASLTLGLASLATDSSQLAGRQSTAVDNTSNLYLDYLVSGKIKMGTSPTAGKAVEVYLYGALNDTPAYPDQITGSDGNVTMTTRDILAACCPLLASFVTTTTTGQVLYMRPMGIAQFFGGILPPKWGLFVVHNSGVSLDSTAGNHVFSYTPVYNTLN